MKPAESNRSRRLCSLLLGLTMLIAAGCKKPPAPPAPAKPVEVFYVSPSQETVTQQEEFTGRTWSPETVELRARVSGYLEAVNFVDGADVKVGDLLFEIDDNTFRATLQQAKTQVAQMQAQFERLQSQFDRAKKLRSSGAVTPQDYDNLAFQTAEAAASKSAADAAVELAQLNLNFTKVLAPISGRISRRLVDPGNLVRADESALANIVSLDPMYAYFDFDERTILKMRRLVEEGVLKGAPDFDRSISVGLAGEEDFSLSGRINWIDNQIDPGTGTLRARAQIDNKKLLLSPGMFVRLRVPVGPEQRSILVPEEALGSDQGQRFVYLVNPQNEIEYRRVEVGWLTNGRRVIHSGLELTDKVVVTGLQRIRPKTKVDARPNPQATATAEASDVSHKATQPVSTVR